MSVELSVIIPSYNERDNVGPLIARLRAVLADVAFEIIYVDDDSPDGTAERVMEEGKKDSRVRCLKRVGKKGLSSACIDGMKASSADVFVVMDADMQHDEAILLQMLSTLKEEDLDIVVGSRYVDGGGMEGWSAERIVASRNATRFAPVITGVKLKDPMSGYFMLKRSFFEICKPSLNGRGFKILLDLMMSSPRRVMFKEVPYMFRTRQFGESKLSFRVVLDYFLLVFDKFLRKHSRTILFLIICSALLWLFLLRPSPGMCPLR